MYLDVKQTVKGEFFQYRHEYTAEAVGSPLRENHALRIGNEEIEIINPAQVERFANQADIKTFPYQFSDSKIVALRKDPKSFLVITFAQDNKVNVNVVPHKKLMGNVRQNIRAQQLLLQQKFEQEAQNLMNVLSVLESL